MAANHYVDNERLLEALIERQKLVDEAREQGLPEPRITDYISDCIMQICHRHSFRPNFINYSYREEMVLDGIENCIKTLNRGNFDPEKSKKPFAYFSQIAFYAFLARIAAEKEESYVKYLLLQHSPFDQFDLQAQDEDAEYTNAYVEFLKDHSDFDTTYFDKKNKAKKPKKEKFDIETVLTQETDNEDKV